MGLVPRLILLASVVAAVLLLHAEPTHADGSWLDAPLQNWNSAGMSLPAAPGGAFSNPRCTQTARPAELDEDQSVTAAGWTLVGTFTGGWGTRVILGASDFDGMCRPTGFQVFIFSLGQFAGTISPVLMNSRADGVVERTTIGPLGGTISASFVRYTQNDPLCCPSATSVVDYRIDSSSGSPVLVPVSSG